MEITPRQLVGDASSIVILQAFAHEATPVQNELTYTLNDTGPPFTRETCSFFVPPYIWLLFERDIFC